MAVVTGVVADLLRGLYPRVLSRTLMFTRNLPDAEDAVQEAVARALSRWSAQTLPEAPEAWLLRVATNVHRDRLRKDKWEVSAHDALETLAQLSPWVRVAVGDPEVASGWKDELLRLVFACCHPALETGESAALCLSTVMGLSVGEVALAFVTEPRSMEQRLTRARRRLRERGDAEGAHPERSLDRLEAVLRVIHLLFNEGYWSSDPTTPIRTDLCRLALGLAHSLAELFPREPEALALLALLLLHDARREARLGAEGDPVSLPEQDRSRWDQAVIVRATQILEAALALGRRGPFQIEAAIAATHCRASDAEETDWPEIAALYALLEALRPTPAVRVNRAFALARAHGPEAGLALLDDRNAPTTDTYPYVHLVRGTLLAELGRHAEARACLNQALRGARNGAESAQIAARIEQLPTPDRANPSC